MLVTRGKQVGPGSAQGTCSSPLARPTSRGDLPVGASLAAQSKPAGDSGAVLGVGSREAGAASGRDDDVEYGHPEEGCCHFVATAATGSERAGVRLWGRYDAGVQPTDPV